eukprot:4730751-Pleurochrysis_carterae.AAC.1
MSATWHAAVQDGVGEDGDLQVNEVAREREQMKAHQRMDGNLEHAPGVTSWVATWSTRAALHGCRA